MNTKNLSPLWLLVALVVLVLQGCNESDQPAVDRQKVEFSFNVPGADVSGGRVESGDVKSILLTLEKSNGESVLDKESLKVYSYGDGYVTEAVALPPGSYRIKEFMLVDDEQNVLYATPMIKSPLAGFVSKPLPFGFSVSRDKSTSVAMEVVSTNTKTPADFGYASFSVTVVDGFRLSVFRADSNKVVLTTANVVVKKGDEVVFSSNASKKVMNVVIKGTADTTYTLIVKKEGYGAYTRNFTLGALKEELGSKPLEVYFHPSLHMTTTVSDDNFLQLGLAYEGTITVDWGDGSREDLTAIPFKTVIEHQYQKEGSYPVTITGNLEGISEIYSFFGIANLQTLNVDRLVNLKSIWFTAGPGPEKVNLSYNNKLEVINFNGTDALKELHLPTVHNLNWLILDGTSLSTAGVDDAINKLYQYAIAQYLPSGKVHVRKEYDGEDDQMVGPPSQAAIEQLKELRDVYGWEVLPNP